MDQIYIFIALGILLCFILFKEIKRTKKSNLSLRLIASLLAIMALFFIFSPIKFNRKISKNQANSAILLTKGYHKDSLVNWAGSPLLSTEKEIATGNKNIRLIAEINEFLTANPDFQSFHIFGHGLERYELESLKGKNLIFHPSKLADGISSINWPTRIRSGEEFLVQGNYLNSQKREIKLILKGMGTNLDSTIIESEGSNFELKCIPKHLDKAVYSLIALADGDTLAKEDLPILVKAKEPIRILILDSSPNFEHKFLKKWLSEQGYHIASRTTISTNKFSSEFINIPKVDLSLINSTLLDKFDLLIGDVQELSGLNTNESQVIQNQVNSGMGLIVKADAIATKPSFYSKQFKLLESKKTIPKSIDLKWEGQAATKNVLQGSLSLSIMPQAGSQNLVKNELGDILINSKLLGKGKLVLSLINDTYTWILGNQIKDYTSFWTYILQKAAKKKDVAVSYTFPQIVVINKFNEIGTDSSRLKINDDKITLIQDPILQFEQKGIWWPKNSGWQSANDDNSWLYTFEESAWPLVRASQRLNDTKKSLTAENQGDKKDGEFYSNYEDRLSPIWFYLLFLICCTYLWLEQKLS
jgi:hypothetical protein